MPKPRFGVKPFALRTAYAAAKRARRLAGGKIFQKLPIFFLDF